MKPIHAGIALCIVAAFIPVRRDQPAAGAVLETEEIDGATRGLLRRACLNCHSSQTRWPWYGHFAPAAWLIARDVRHARAAIDFSEWPRYGAARGALLELARDRLNSGRMPPRRYTLLHPEARLSPEEKQHLLAWFRQASARRLRAKP